MMSTFEELVASRRAWIEETLRPWCMRADRKELKKAADEWGDIAGRVDPESTLWTWAWSRFPQLVHEGLAGVDETHEVRLKLRDGTSVVGFPDGRQSSEGRLVLMCSAKAAQTEESGPHSIDDIENAERVDALG